MSLNSQYKSANGYRSERLSQYIQKLTAPALHIENVEHKHQARFLASLLLAFILFAMVSLIVQLFTIPDFIEIFPVLGMSLVILMAAYFLSRTKHFAWGILITITIPSLAVFINLIAVPTSAQSVGFLLISILLSSVFLRWEWTLVLIVMHILILALITLIVPELVFEQIAASLFMILITSALILVNLRYRDALETIRQVELVKNENRYRMLISQSPFSTVVYAPDGNPLFYNQSAIKLWNVSEQDLDFFQSNYNVLQDKQLAEKGVLEFVKKGFAGQPSVAPPSLYEFQREDVNGRIITDERWIVGHVYPILDENEEILEVVLIHEDLTETLQAAEKLEQRNRELTLLNRVISVASASLKQEDILQFVCREIATVFGVSHTISGLFFEDMTSIQIASAVLPAGTPNMAGEVISIRPFHENPDANILLTPNKYLHIEDVNANLELAPAYDLLKQLKIRSLLVLPLVLRDSMIGVIALGKERPHIYEQSQINLASSIASSVSQALQNAEFFEEVHRHTSELERRVAKRTVDLENANQQLQALAKVKDEFVSNVSHELRTPISNIKLYHDLLSINPQKQEKYMATLLRETGRLEHIVESLLHLSRLDQETLPMRLTSIDLNVIGEIRVSDRHLQAQKRGIELIFDGDANLPEINGDMMQLGQVLSILLTNALNYSTDGGRVIVQTGTAVKNNKEWVTCSVLDNGPGISAEEQSRLFERFFRGVSGRQSDTPGTGLGLSIAKKIIDRHHGHIEVESDGIPGNGTNMTIWLPAHSSQN